MNFVSDNCYGATPEILAAIASIGQSPEPAYGDDDVTQRVTTRFCEIFEREVAVFPVVSGTAANALALATLVPPHGAIFCHAEAHIAVDECGAPEFFTHGAKLVAIESLSANIASGAVSAPQNLSSPLLVPKIKIEASGRKTSGSIMNTSMPILSGRATSNPRTCRIAGANELMSVGRQDLQDVSGLTCKS